MTAVMTDPIRVEDITNIPDNRPDKDISERTIEPGKDNWSTIQHRLDQVLDGTKVMFPGTITLDRTPEVKPTAEKPRRTTIVASGMREGDGLQYLTDTGGLDGPGARKRAHLRFIDVDYSGTCKLTITGTHPYDGRAKSPILPSDYWKTTDDDPGNDSWPTRNIWEDQAGVEFVHCNHWRVMYTNIRKIWGDPVGSSGKGSGTGYVHAHGGKIIGGIFDRNGRVMTTVYTDDFEWRDTVCKNRAGDVYHIETGSNPRAAIHNHLVTNVQYDGDGRFATLSSGTLYEGITIQEIVGRMFYVQARGALDSAGRPLARRIRLLRNVSTEVIKSMALFSNVEDAEIVNNVAVIDPRNAPAGTKDGLRIVNCPRAILTPNFFTRLVW